MIPSNGVRQDLLMAYSTWEFASSLKTSGDFTIGIDDAIILRQNPGNAEHV